MKLTLHRVAPGNYITEDGHFRIYYTGGMWYALDTRTASVIAARDRYAATKQELIEYVRREIYRRQNGFWARIRAQFEDEEGNEA